MARIFESYRKEVEEQRELNNQIEHLIEKYSDYKQTVAKLSVKISNIKKSMHQQIDQFNQSEKVFALMKELCGGEEAYDALRVIDLGERAKDGTGYIDFITPEEMTEPVVRFKDHLDRPGIAIKAKFGIYGKVEVQTFFQRYAANEGTWVDAGKRLIGLRGGALIDQGRVNQKAFMELQELIKKGTAITTDVTTLTQWTLELVR